MLMSLQIHMLKPYPTHNVTVHGDESCVEVKKGKMRSWGGALTCRAGALIRGGRDTSARFLCQGRTQDLHTYKWVRSFWEKVI